MPKVFGHGARRFEAAVAVFVGYITGQQALLNKLRGKAASLTRA